MIINKPCNWNKFCISYRFYCSILLSESLKDLANPNGIGKWRRCNSNSPSVWSLIVTSALSSVVLAFTLTSVLWDNLMKLYFTVLIVHIDLLGLRVHLWPSLHFPLGEIVVKQKSIVPIYKNVSSFYMFSAKFFVRHGEFIFFSFLARLAILCLYISDVSGTYLKVRVLVCLDQVLAFFYILPYNFYNRYWWNIFSIRIMLLYSVVMSVIAVICENVQRRNLFCRNH